MTVTKFIIDLPVYEFVRESQLQHGLKYDDHRQYRSYCSRRLHRIRKSLNVHQNIPPAAKARHQRARKLMDVSNVMVIEAGDKNEEYAKRMLIIPLCLAERAWSYAMQLKQEVVEYPRTRYHMVRRLKKAAEFASKFEILVHDKESPCSKRTKKEATAYSTYMLGLYSMEREQWADAKYNFNKSLVHYMGLSLSVKCDTMLEQYRLRIEELRASSRFCMFALSEKPKSSKFNLPSILRFYDIALRHAKQVQAEQLERKQDQKQKIVASPAKVVDQCRVEQKQEREEEKPKENKPDDKEDEDEVDEVDDEEEDEEDDDDDEYEDAPQESSGVTGLVKSWFFNK